MPNESCDFFLSVSVNRVFFQCFTSAPERVFEFMISGVRGTGIVEEVLRRYGNRRAVSRKLRIRELARGVTQKKVVQRGLVSMYFIKVSVFAISRPGQ